MLIRSYEVLSILNVLIGGDLLVCLLFLELLLELFLSVRGNVSGCWDLEFFVSMFGIFRERIR